MLVRLNGARRSRAGWFVALVYLFCVLAPSLSFAFGDARAAPCLIDDDHAFGLLHTHEHSTAASPDLQTAGDKHHQTVAVAHFTPDGMSRIAAPSSEVPAGPHHNAPDTCCGMVCPSALPASIFEIVAPSQPKSLRVSGTYRKISDDAPPRLYRPPIA